MATNPFSNPDFGSDLLKEDSSANPFSDPNFDGSPPARGFKGWAQDAAATAVKGAISVPEAIVGLADIPTGGRVGKFLENKDGAFGFRPDEAKAIANDWHSDATKEAQRKFQEADGIWDKTKTAVQNPSLIATTVGESLPSMVAGGAIGRGLLAATKYGAMAANAGRLSASEAAALKAAQISAGAAGEGATMAGSAAEQIRQQTDDRLLSPTQAAAAAGTGVMGGVVSRLSGGLANKLGIGEADTMLTQGARGVVNDVASAKSIPRQVIGGAVTEGLLEELPQSVGEQILQNLALNKNWAEGLDDAVVMGALSGGLMGSGAAGLHGFMAKGGAPALTPEQSQAQHRQPAPEQPLQLGNSPDPLIQFRDGTVARQSEIDAHLASLPERERQAFTAQILGYAPQQADEKQMTTSPGAAAFDGNANQQQAASVAAPEFGTSLGAQSEQQGGGIDYQRQIDTSGLSLERLDSPFAQPVPATALDRQALARQGAYPISPTHAPVLDTRRLSEQLGLSSNNGGLESAAAYAVDSGATPIAQALNSQPTGVVNGAQTQEAQQAVAGQSQGAGAQERVAAAPKIRAVKLKDGTTAHVNEADLTSGASQLRTFTADGKPRAARLQATHIAPAAPKVVLQNRNRATPASIAQMNAIAGKPDFLRTGASNTMDNGAPIVFGDLPQKVAIGRAQMVADGNGQRVPTQYAVVEAQDLITSNHADGSPVAEYANGVDGKLRAVAGNGRAAGLKAAWQRGTAGQYGQELMQDAPNLGIAPDVLAQFEAPVLVRVMDAADVTPDMGDRSNVQAGLQMSAVEQASNDAQRLNLRDMEFDELGNPTAQTVMRFMQGMPVQERGNMLDSQGRATSQLLDRIRAAAFKQAYMSDSLVELAAQSADPEAKNILNGLAIVAGDMAQLAGAGDFDIRQAVTDAANMAVTAGRTGQSIAQYLQTRQIDENPETVVVMQFMAQNVRSAKRIADGLRAWAELAQSQIAIARQNAEQDTMFGDAPTLSRRELFERLNNDNLTEIEQQQLIEQQRRAELTKQGTQRPSTERAGNADGASDGAESRGTEPTNAQDAGREQADFALEQQTPEQIRAQEEAQAQAARDKAKEDAQAAEAERKSVERQEVTQRSEAAANDFQLGQSAEDNLSGQGDIFSSAPAQPESKPKNAKEALERVRAKNAAEKPAKNDATRLGSGATGVADNALSGKDAGAPDKDGNTIVGRRADGVMIRQDKQGVRFYFDSGVRISEAVSLRPTRAGMQIDRGELKPDFMTAEESAERDDEKPKQTEAATGNVQQAIRDAVQTDHLANEQVDQVAAIFDRAEGKAKKEAKPAPAAKPPSADKTRAKADLMNALADLGDIFGKSTRLNIMPEQEQKLLPVLTRVLDAAFRLGYHKFKDAAKFSLDQIRQHLGKESADAITLDHLQGAYIAMAGGKQGVDTKRSVIDVESKAEIEAHEAAVAEEQDEVQSTGAQLLSDSLLSAIRAGKMPKDNLALKKLVEEFDGNPADPSRMKEAQEQLEAAIVRFSREIVAKGEGDKKTFDALLSLYESQPNLNVRTSTSIANQAYSTPAPLAYLASQLAGITKQTLTHEPTAGTGMLLIGADPKNTVVNELNDLRASLLEQQGFTPTQKDAATEPLRDKRGPVDAVITNPPFGSVKDESGKPTKVKVDGYNLGQIDHLIAARALETMKDDGRATLILGANKAPGGLSTDDRIFFNWLYSHYNVVGHFEVEGDLYARQGAGWPVRVIAIAGREKSSRVSPIAGTIERVDNWSKVYEQYKQLLDSSGRPVGSASVAIGRPSEGKARPPGVPDTAGQEVAAPNRQGRTERTGGDGNVTGASARAIADLTGATTDSVGYEPDEQRLNAQSFIPPRLDEAGQGAKPAPAKRPAKPAGASAVENAPATAGNEFQSSYIPRSARKDEGVLIPSNMAQPTQDALNHLEDQVGNIDEFARKELGYDSTEALYNALMGLQVDSVATAIHQIKQGKAVVIADQTGIGKGRQAAAIIRWAARSGMTPVFVSVKPSLFTDMYGDLADIGTHDVEPFILNLDAWVSGREGEKLFANKASSHRAAIEAIANNGALPAGRNALFMTYSQINTDNAQRRALRALAGNAVFVLDESHNAAGASGTGGFMISVLKEAKGVTYLSATYAKRPDNMPLYFKTDIGEAAADSEGLSNAMAAGGLPLQTVVSNNLVKAGQMFRRERSYDGVSIASTFDRKNRTQHEEMSDTATQALRAIVQADRLFHEIYVKQLQKQLKEEGGGLKDIAGNQASASVQHTEFSSVVHNFVRQMLLGLKAQTAADEAIASLKRGEKPIIAVENTMGSFLSEYASSNGLTQGDSLGSFDYRTVLSRALERSRALVETLPTGDEVRKTISLEKLDPITRKAYDQAQDVIDGLKIAIPVSPIDWMRAEIKRAGFSVAEITGRNLAVDYSDKGKPVLSAIDQAEQRDKVATTRRFNGGELDALILNVAGSTGISLHASEKFQDQRQRHMIVAQAAGDINIFMQMLGRIHRTGQVRLPKYTILSVDLPTEKRPTAVLSKKMKSLNANTSSNTESATSVKTADILNKYGDQIVHQYLQDNMDLARQLDVDDIVEGDTPAEDIARKATGRLALQPIEVQNAFYEDVEAQYDALIEYLNKTNQNDLEPRTFDFDAKETRSEILFDGPNKETPFGADAVYGEYSIKAQGVAMKPEEIQAAIAENLQGKTGADHAAEMQADLDAQYKQFVEKLAAASNDAGATNKSIESAGVVREAGAGFMRSHAIGKTFRVEINSEPYNAVITNVRNTHKDTGNPFSLSKFQITIAVNGALRSITVPATQFRKIEVSSIAPAFRIETLFKEQPPNQRETAKIITGNLLAAYGELKGVKGTIISFTKSDGRTEQGILLPKLFNYSKNTQGDYRLRSGKEALNFLQRSENKDIGRFGIATRDGLVRVLPFGEGVQVRVPRSKAQGARYFLDKNLLSITGDFVSTANAMTAKVDNQADAVRLIDSLMEKQALYALPSMADEAKALATKDEKAVKKNSGLNADEEGFGTRERTKAGTPTDRDVMDMVRDGKTAQDVLRLIAGTSRSKFNKQVARLLLKTGAAPSVHIVGDLGSKGGFKHLAKYSRKNHALSMTEAATGRAEQIFLHEMIHAATLMALDRKSLPSVQMRVLFNHVKKQGGAAGQYGMTNVGEFVSEAFTNPKFQQALRGMKAPAQSPLHSAWDYLVRTIKSILGLPHDSTDALSAALEIGVSVMRENMALRKKGVRGSGSDANAGIDQTQTPEFKRWFGDSKVVDADGKPLVVYHGTRTKGEAIDSFDIQKAGSKTDSGWMGTGFYFGDERAADAYAGHYEFDPGHYPEGGAVYPVYLTIQNPAILKDSERNDGPRTMVRELLDLADEASASEVRAALLAAGYDGVIYERFSPYGNGYREYVAFRPNQIKSATGNSGAFDGTNPDIRFGRSNIGQQGAQNGQENGMPRGLSATSTAQSRTLEDKINADLRRLGDAGDGLFRAASIPQNQLPDALSRALVAFREATGTAVHIFRNLTPQVLDFNGVSFRDGTVHINETSQNPATLTAAHEWLHNLRRTNPDLYRELADEVARQGRLPEYQQRLKRDGETRWKNMDVVEEELTAAAVSDALTDPVFLQRLAERDQSAFRRVAKAFLEFLKTLTAGWKDQGSNAYLQDVEAFRDKLEQVLDKLPVAKQKPGDIQALFLRVWHGSPHRGIEQTGFKLNKIGTGDGQQAYGWGMYFAESELEANLYVEGADGQLYQLDLPVEELELLDWDRPIYEHPDGIKQAILRLFPNDGETYRNDLWERAQEDFYENGPSGYDFDRLQAAFNEAMESDGYGEVFGSGVWDELKEAAPSIAWKSEIRRAADGSMDGLTGGGIYRELVNTYGSARAASEKLLNEGVQGAKFTAGDNATHNYVIWDEALLTPEKAQIEAMYSRASPTTGAGVWQSPEPTKFDQWTYLLQDKQIDTKRVLNAIKSTGQQVDDAQDVYLQETLYHGRTAKRVKGFAEQEERPLMELMRDKGLSLGQVEEYLHARHAPEANKALAERNPSAEVIAANLKAAQAAGDEGEAAKWRNAKPYTGTEEDRLALSGMSDAEAAAVMAALTPEQRTNLQAAAKMVDAIVAKTRQTFVEYGLETQETVDAWGKAWAHYVPLMREQPEDTGMAGMGTGQGFSVKGKETKGRTGSTKKVVDILANINMQRERAIVRGEKNRVATALLGLVKDNPNKDFWHIAEPGEIPSTQVIDKKTGLVTTQIDPLFKSRDNALIAKVNGVEKVIIFNENDERATRMAVALKNMDAANLEGLLGNVASVTRYLAAVNTQYNPIFGVVNIVRDFQEAAINMQKTPLAGKQKQVLGNAPKAIWQIGMELRAQRKGEKTGSEYGSLWEEFQEQGGQTGYRDMFNNSAERSKQLQNLLKPDAWADTKAGRFFTVNGALKVPLEILRKTALRPMLDLLSDYNEAIENGVRLSAYKAALDIGMSKPRAAELAKNLTVNFNRKGQVAQQVGALYAFFNASVQGTARMGQTIFDMEPGKPKTIRLSSFGKKIVGGGVLLGSVQALLLAASGFGDDEPPEFIRERNLVIPNPLSEKGYISIPMPLGYHVLANLGRIPTEYALGGFKDGAKRAVSIVDVLADIYNPLGGSGLSMQTISPTVLDPFAALAENKDFTGRPIAKESFNKTTPGHALGRDTSSMLAQGMAQVINYATGGTEYTRGELSPTPDQIDYLIGQVTGGVGREASKVSQSTQAIATGDELPWHKVPLAGRFYGSADTPAAAQSAYYNTLDDVRRHAAEVKGLRNDGRGQDAIAYMQKHPQAAMHIAANRAETTVKKLRDRISELKEQDAPREQVKALEMQMTEVMQQFSAAIANKKKSVAA